jgi:hypothetical protein
MSNDRNYTWKDFLDNIFNLEELIEYMKDDGSKDRKL